MPAFHRLERSQMQELPAIAAHHRHVQAAQHRRHGDVRAAVHIRVSQAHLDRVGGVVDHRQFDVGDERLADMGPDFRLAQFGRMRAGGRENGGC
ncbi:hypothetical protein G4G28_07320 [Massilia sp. Dwa41.01b]|uniref:hypothetical protein n=1 Tax=Massilia sp. Dwa41.01b TaxID=2709302 RepID=UPI0015FF0128|nr:hypothetical protein [Massilia sp. Dwa41.01b]QNA87215.1 hypothetical protein G4G28_07320 [Massilia sp. Dwa41.01b]